MEEVNKPSSDGLVDDNFNGVQEPNADNNPVEILNNMLKSAGGSADTKIPHILGSQVAKSAINNLGKLITVSLMNDKHAITSETVFNPDLDEEHNNNLQLNREPDIEKQLAKRESVETAHSFYNDMNEQIDNKSQENNNASILQTMQQSTNNDNMSIDQHYNNIIKRLREKVIIYEYMCYRTHRYYNKRNKFLLMPSILISSALTLVNTDVFQPNGQQDTQANRDSIYKMINVIFNGILTLMIAMQNVLKYAEKADYFFNLKKKFTKLHNNMNNEILNQITNARIEHNTLASLMKEYDYLDESIHHEFPRSIILDTKEKFKNFSLPTICNGIDVEKNDVQPKGFTKKLANRLGKTQQKKVYSIV